VYNKQSTGGVAQHCLKWRICPTVFHPGGATLCKSRTTGRGVLQKRNGPPVRPAPAAQPFAEKVPAARSGKIGRKAARGKWAAVEQKALRKKANAAELLEKLYEAQAC